MSAIDILIIIIIAIGGFLGFSKGILAQLGQIAGLILGIIAARLFGPQVCEMFGEPTVTTVVASYAIVFLLGYGLTWLVVKMVRTAVRTVHLGILDRLAGAAFKIAEWVILLSLVLNVAMLVTHDDAELRRPDKPWREAVLDAAPKLLGYMYEIHDTQKNDNKQQK